MKKVFAILLLLSLSVFVYPVQAATRAEIDAAIDSGIEWLAAQQNTIDGSWGTSRQIGHTGFAVLKLETHAIQMGKDPLDSSYEYYSNVTAGLDYIFSMATNISIAVQPAGDPDTNGNGWGTYFAADPTHRGYESAVAMMAIAASTHPEMVVNVPGSAVDGRTYFDVLQDAVDYYAFGQEETGVYRGGWRYLENSGSADNSVSGLVATALTYAEADQVEGAIGFSCIVPQFVKNELSLWIDYIQNDFGTSDDGTEDDPDGGSGYVDPNYWVNILKTGNLLFEMAFVGDLPTAQRVMNAIDYIERHWNDANDGAPFGEAGWRGESGEAASYLAIYSLMKGFDAFSKKLINNGSAIDWFDEVTDVILLQQNPDGSWPTSFWGDSILSTEWCLLVLQHVSPLKQPPVGGLILTVDPLGLLLPIVTLVSLIVIIALTSKGRLRKPNL